MPKRNWASAPATTRALRLRRQLYRIDRPGKLPRQFNGLITWRIATGAAGPTLPEPGNAMADRMLALGPGAELQVGGARLRRLN